jgi:prepilin-type processing-associated H-X9-DG protein
MMAARSRHPSGVQAVLCDGHVAFFQDSIPIATWRALGTSEGGETFTMP